VDHRNGNIRLRQGEYQYDLAKVIATFQLELYFPDVKDITKRLYGEEKSGDVQFIRKVQTILKKMEKANITRILPKNKPWELQRYALLSFKFQDTDKNLVVLATDHEMKQSQDLLQSILSQEKPRAGLYSAKIKICVLAFTVVASYMAVLWDFIQPIIDPIVFVPAFSIAVACSILLGKVLSQE
jgi:hypothetical protein